LLAIPRDLDRTCQIREYATLITTEPEPQYDNDASFRVVWISDAERFDYKACE